MSTPFGDYLQALIAALAEGSSVDWSQAHSHATTDDDRRTMRQLRTLLDIAAAGDRTSDLSGANGREAISAIATPEAPPTSTRYAIERSLGRGGFGVVYKAYDQVRHSHVALKSYTRADVGVLYDFKKEFRILADLSHPNLVSLYELYADEESWFIAMELVNGVDFLTYIRGASGLHENAGASGERARRQAPACDLTRLGAAVTQLCDALTYLHSEGKLHCDVKPSNVLVTSDGQLKLLDFGLAIDALPAAGDETLRIHGTPMYVAPEQAAGERATSASDWYSVGVMLFEALTGRPPFQGTIRQVLEAKRHGDAPLAATLCSGIPPELDSLCARLLDRQPEARPSDAEVADAVARLWPPMRPATEPPPVRAQSSPFVGRRPQLAVLDAAYERSLVHCAQAVFVHGASGLGKTALVHRFLDGLRTRDADVVILEGRCYERESVPYKALDSLVDRLTRYLRTLPRGEADALLPRDAASLLRLFPVLRRVNALVEVRQRLLQAASAQEMKRRGAAAFRELMARLVERHPVVLVIDDLQWTDADSAALLGDLLWGGDPMPLLFVGCYRTEEATTNPSLTALLASVEAAGTRGVCERQSLAVDELSPGDAYELAQLLRERHRASVAAEAIVRESGRSPLFINQLVQYSAAIATAGRSAVALAQDASAELTLDSVIRARTARLHDETRRLLQVVALAGGPIALSVASDAASLADGGLRESIALRSARLIRLRVTATDEQVEIYHDRIREAITSALAPAEARELHAALATTLEHQRADPERLVEHFHGAGQDETAARYAVIAGDRAREALAFDRAARAYRFALDVGQHEDGGRSLRVKLGDALAAGGRAYEAAQVYISAADLAAAREVVELKRRAAEQLLQSGHIDAGIAVLRDVLPRVGLRLARSPRRALLALLLLRARIAMRGFGFILRREAELAEDAIVRVDTCWSVTTGLAFVDHIRSAEFGARHLLLALQLGEPLRLVRGLAMEMAYRSIAGARSEPQNRKLIGLAEQIAHEVANPEAIALVTLAKGSAAYMQGNWRVARERCEEAEAILREKCTGVAWPTETSQFYTLLSLAHLGEIAELSRRLPVLLKEARERDALYAETILRVRLYYLTSLAANDSAGAEREVREAMQRWSQRGFHNQHYYQMVATTDIALYRGDGAGAWANLQRVWPQFARTLLLRVQPILIESLHLRARTAIAAAVDAATPVAARESLVARARRNARRLRQIDARWAHALGELIEASVATLRDDRQAAIARLTAAETLFDEEHMGLHAAVASLRRAELLGDADASGIARDTTAWLRARGIVEPAQFSRMLIPGLFARGDSPRAMATQPDQRTVEQL